MLLAQGFLFVCLFICFNFSDCFLFPYGLQDYSHDLPDLDLALVSAICVKKSSITFRFSSFVEYRLLK